MAPSSPCEVPMPDVRVYPTQAEQAQAAADLFVSLGREPVAARGRFRAALSGGHDPHGMFEALKARPGDLDWGKVELYWVDERWVEWASPESNYGEAKRRWLDSLGSGPACFPMYRGPGNPEDAAEAYESLLMRRLGGRPPVLDLALLGMGPDGHTASLFPGSEALGERQRSCIAVRHPATGQVRLTLTLPVLNSARAAAFIVHGAAKAGTLARVLAGDAGLPAAWVKRDQGGALWLADREAAPGA